MHVIVIILLILSFVSFLTAAVNKSVRDFNMIALGLAFWVLAVLLPMLIVVR